MRKLYVLHGCPFAHRAAIALREKEIPFETVFFRTGQRPPELEAVGPRAKSPTLFDGDAPIHDSLVVLEYLEDRYPERPLLPRDPVERARARMLVTRVSDEVGPKQGAIAKEALKAEPDPAKVAAAAEDFRALFGAWDQQLEGRPFLGGADFGLADIALYTLLVGARRLSGVEVGPEHPRLRTWFERVESRPSSAVPEPADAR